MLGGIDKKMSTKYLKVKPSEDFFRKYGIKNFEIEYVNLFSKKREIEIFVRVHNFKSPNFLLILFLYLKSKYLIDFELYTI